ncbi:hypothetical protein [Streptomyces sp. NBC_00076]|uniref:hypothetical protein n=1 Tax=Streptomyces sp. NBC_00076 TaxID=2975642 RepID=UPI0032493AB5
MRRRLHPSAAVVATAAIAAALPAVAAPTAHATEGGPALVISTLPSTSPKPGEVYDEPATVTNNGTTAADGVTFRIRLTRGLDFPEPVAGCVYSTVENKVRQALCELDTVVAPGASVTVPVRFKALPNALMESVEYGTSATGEAPGEGYDDSYRRLALTADSTADLAATGDRAKARPGSEVTVRATLRNDGPGWVQNQESDDLAALLVKIPAGTVAVDVPKECAPFGVDGPSGPSAPGKPRYVCWSDGGTLDVGQSFSYTFVLKVDDDARDTKGEVKATSVYDIHPEYDKNPANDTAYLSVDLPGDPDEGSSGGAATGTGGATEGGSGSGGEGNDPQGQAAGGSGTTGSTSGGASAGGSTGNSTGGTGSSGGTGDEAVSGDLASTGTGGTPFIAGAAAAAAALGSLLVVAVRRRAKTASS